MRHLTDEEIQAYIDGEAASRPPQVEAHLAECPVCSGVLREYRRLYSALANDRCFAPSFLRATKALSELRLREKAETGWDRAETAVATLGIAGALAVALWAYTALGGPGAGWTEFLATSRRYLSPALESLRALANAAGSVGAEVGLVVTACFVLYVILSLDYLLVRPSARQATNG